MDPVIGVNVPYLRGDYGHDLAENPRFPTWPCRFDPQSAYRPIIEARRLGFGAIRIWLCENAEGIVLEGGRVAGVSERLTESVRILQEAAALHGLRVYWTFLDANSIARDGDTVTRAVLGEPDEAERFAERVVRPLVRLFDPAITFAIDLVNEPETSTAECDAPDPIAWETLTASIAALTRGARAEREGLVTVGTTHAFLPKLAPIADALSAVDIHMYHPGGGLPPREDLVRYAGGWLADKPLIAGEAGIPKDPGPEDPAALTNFIHNARKLDYAAVFLWQLQGDLIDAGERDRPMTWLASQVRRLTLGY
ncbi:MAG: hypothetical protein AB7S26_32235 [Sandaracinaceae bacterium]